jgi:hypothetical protein
MIAISCCGAVLVFLELSARFGGEKSLRSSCDFNRSNDCLEAIGAIERKRKMRMVGEALGTAIRDFASILLKGFHRVSDFSDRPTQRLPEWYPGVD